MNPTRHSLFQVFGIELEYVIVDRETSEVRPVADRLLHAVTGEWAGDWSEDQIGWSNELVLHVLELRNVEPAPSIDGLVSPFHLAVNEVNELLGRWNARLMPTGMHPWMRPRRDARLWPHANAEIYQAYDRVFDCRRHGWSNVQSVQVNLPFDGPDEFARLMAAVRLVLPLVPAIAASSPLVEGALTGALDNRLLHYFENSARIPAMSGRIIPEAVFDPERYQHEVLAPLYAAVSTVEDGVLGASEWLNARGAIARFDRSAIEVRLLDSQECCSADLATSAAVAAVTRALVEERWSSHDEQAAWPLEPLRELLDRCARQAGAAELGDPALARLFGAEGARTVGELWETLVAETFEAGPDLTEAIDVIVRRGSLAERILEAVGPKLGRERVQEVYSALSDCLEFDRPFEP